ncbi:TonB-dependent receptor [Sphingomicrobium flavum]|uniref:TonB-dependent receptor n=1 Tax=Sphingomicrobium flavum TaxID=1229164 RepID=UPI0021ADA662|nr:TonB-dependent receptor [Sphingomicrobium flavum]
MRITTQLVSLTAMAAATAFATPAFAQATSDTDTAVQDADEGVEAIVITAQRREQNLQDVPLSVATVDDDTLAAINTGGADIRGLSGRVPSLNIESSFGRTFPRFYIRGLGNTDFDLNASQPVSLVYDEVVLENPILKGFPVFDIDRIEVLRGPQGTLFGRNTPAGIVKFDTAKPGSGAGNFARLSWGSFNTLNVEAGMGADLGDKLSFRLSGLYQHRDDWVDNLDESGSKDLEGYDDLALRAQLQFEDGNTTLRFVGQYRDQEGSARVFRANSFATGSNQLIGADGGDFERDEVRADGLNFQELTTYNIGAHLEVDMGAVTLYGVTSYWNGELESRGDIDGGFGNAFAPEMGPGFIPFSAQSQDNVPGLDQFTAEVRIASNNSGGLGYQAGLFYFSEQLEISSFDFGTPTDTTPAAIALQEQDSDALGIFGSVNYAFDNGLTLQAGMRWNKDERDFTASRPTDNRPGFLGFGGPVDPISTSVDDEVITWDAAATYELNSDVNLYARVAKGYRAPSIQGRLLFGRDLSVADSETTMSYEAGIKTELLDRKLRFNLGAYYFVTDDLQLTAVGGGNNFTTLINAEEVTGQGFEAELTAAPTRGLTLTAGLSYNDTEINDPGLGVAGCGAPCTINDPVLVPAAGFAPAIYEIDGNVLPQAPKWTLNWTAGYELPLGSGDLYVFTDWYYRSKIQFFLYDSVEFTDDKLLEGGLRVGYRTNSVDIAAFVRNITNDESAVGGIDFNNLTGFVNEPRIYGVELGVRF